MISYKLNPNDKLVTITFKGKNKQETFDAPILVSLNKTIISPQRIDGKTEEILYAANLYMDTLPEETQYQIYKANHIIYESLLLYPGDRDISSACEFVHEHLKQLMPLPGMCMEEIYHWCKEVVPVPDTIEHIFTEAKRRLGHTREQTYLYDEYLHLTALGTMIKILFPIIYMLQHFSASSRNAKNRRNRDTFLLQRITYSVLPKEIITTPGFLRLESFVLQSTLRSVVTPGKIINDGMTTESKLPYTTSVLLISKLALSTFFNANGKKNLASHLYSSIGQIFRINKRTEIKDKLFTANSGDVEHSYTEMYVDSEEYFIHDQMAMTHVANIDILVVEYKSQITVGTAREQHKLLNSTGVHTSDIQEAICSNVLRWVVPPDAFIIMNSQLFNGCCAVASELLKEKHPVLSLLLLSTCELGIEKENGKHVPLISPIVYKEPPRLPRQKLRTMYPFWTVSDRITQLNQSKLTNSKHVMHDYIRDLLTDARKVWKPILTEGNNIYFREYMRNEYIMPMPDLYMHLIEFFLDLDNIGNISTEGFDKALAGTLEI